MPGDRRRSHAVGTTVGTLLAVVPLVLAGLWGAGHAPRAVDLVSGAAWLVSPARGLVTLVDGPSAQVAVTLRLPVADPTTSVVQGRDAAYVVRAGTLARVDAATWTVGGAVAFADAGTALTVLPGRTTGDLPAPLWVLDGRTVRAVDSRTLEVRATADLPLDEPVRAVVDDRGDVWAADDDHVARVRLAHGGLRVAPERGDGGDLVLVQGRAVLVDVPAGTVRALDGPRTVACRQTRSQADRVAVVGSSTSPEVFTAAYGTLRVAGTHGGTCGTLATVGAEDADLGALAQVGTYVVATDRRTGVTTVVDRSTGTPQTFALAEPGHRVELVVRGSTVFWNDLDGHGSGLLELGDDAWRSTTVDKYDPTTGVGAQVPRTAPTGPDASSAPATFRIDSLVTDRTLYAPGAPALVTPDVTGEPAPGEVWWWRFEDLATGTFEDFRTPTVPLSISALPDVGEYAVTLVVVRDGGTATATTTLRVVTWCPLTVSAPVVDLATDPTVQVSVDPACPVRQQITVTAAGWLQADTSGDFAPGAPGTITLRTVGPPPSPGPVAGALTLEVTGQPASQVRVDVVGVAP
ncbi:hypothetical protein H9657_09895 [Cellulomonas sp. Sa3CUA2]|uniref:PKD domain-containing protein n=1 Tax=Cellulomonas avistercoris TaxID=2762242 RepID=A0ABR8QDU0_9CELL|nr:hypothetical protein [Cellulomonas avistercoris]MBD7918584.1 hypothetical protein [Cellulomonas avistercoris]